MNTFHLATDGSMKRNRSSWAYVLRNEEKELIQIKSGHLPGYGINYAEFLAVIEGLESIQEPGYVFIYTDSKCVIENHLKKGELQKRFSIQNKKHCIYFVKVGKNLYHDDHRWAHSLARDILCDQPKSANCDIVWENRTYHQE